MGIKICAIGGYNEVGKNMTAIKIDDEVVVLDMGVHLESYIEYTEEEEDLRYVSKAELQKVGAVPNDKVIGDWKSKVKAIIPTHAHLDHIAAIPFMSSGYKCPIIATPFTVAVLSAILEDERMKIKNRIITLNENSKYRLSKDITVEFINMTHSTPQTVMVALHTKYGIIVYANDFKFDNYPTLGLKANTKRLQELGKKGIKLLICDSTYAPEAKKTPSESVAKEMLRDVLLGTDARGKAIVVSTFSSHLSRLKEIIGFGKKLERKILFMGRSLGKYVKAGEDIGIINFSKDVEIVKYSKKVKQRFKKINPKDYRKYLFVVTGHQGEPRSVLSKMVNGSLGFKFSSEDHVVFSCTVIPTDINKRHRERLESELKQLGVRIFKDIHVSGHAAREDLRDLINYVNPEHIIPAHGEIRMTTALQELAVEMGYKINKDVHVMQDGQVLSLK